MPYIVDTSDRPDASLGDVTPSFGESLSSSVRSTFGENASTLLFNSGALRQANAIDKPRLQREDAEARVKQAGVKLKIPEDGYTAEALDILIQRQRDHAAIRSVQDRTPWSWIGTPVRGTAQLLTGVVDPLNIASAFIPVVREQRAAAMLARAGASTLGRAGVRAGIGAAEGAVGAAVLEPLVYGLHRQLQDDYGMADSLVNLAFGSLLGGGLHATVGAVSDLTAPRIRDLTIADVVPPRVVPREAAAGSVADVLRAADPETREVAMRSAVADAVEGRAPDVAPVVTADARAAAQAAEAQIAPIRAEVETDVRAAAAADAPAARVGQEPTPQDKAPSAPREYAAPQPAPAASAEPTLRELQAANAGATKLADAVDAAAARAGADPRHIYAAEVARLRQAAREVPPEVARRYEAMASMLEQRAALLPPPKLRDVGTLLATGNRAERPGVSADAGAANAADQRLSAAPKDAGVEAAQAELDAATQRLADLQRYLESGGVTTEQSGKLIDGLKPFDDAIADAKNIGDAVRALATCWTMT